MAYESFYLSTPDLNLVSTDGGEIPVCATTAVLLAVVSPGH